MSIDIKLDLSGLDQIKKALSRNYEVQVGVFADKTTRDQAVTEYNTQRKSGKTSAESAKAAASTVTNAELGAIHEFGSYENNIPARSWLRMPLTKKAKDISKYMAKQDWEKAMMGGSLGKVLQLMGFKAEQVIDEAFATSGYGQWRANKPATIARKGSDKPLIDTGELRRSIMSKVTKK